LAVDCLGFVDSQGVDLPAFEGFELWAQSVGHGPYYFVEVRWNQIEIRLQVQHLAGSEDEVHYGGETSRVLQVHRGANAEAPMALG
jgi:hypothetical protein